MIEHPVNLNEVLPFCCSFDRLISQVALPYLYYASEIRGSNEPVQRAKGGRQLHVTTF